MEISYSCFQLVERHIIHSCGDRVCESKKSPPAMDVFHSGLLRDIAVQDSIRNQEDLYSIPAIEGQITPTVFNNECK